MATSSQYFRIPIEWNIRRDYCIGPPRKLDAYTWSNMFEKGLALTRDRTRIPRGDHRDRGRAGVPNSLSAPFIFDDQTAILDNQRIRQLWPLSVPLSPLRETPVAGRPIVNLTFALNYAAGGMDTRGYRLTNLGHPPARRADSIRSRAPHTTASFACSHVWRAGHEPGVDRRAHLDAAPVADRDHRLRHAAHRVDDGTLLLADAVLQRAGARGTSGPMAGSGDRRLRDGNGCKESMATAPVMVVLFDYAFVGPRPAAQGTSDEALRRFGINLGGARNAHGIGTKDDRWLRHEGQWMDVSAQPGAHPAHLPAPDVLAAKPGSRLRGPPTLDVDRCVAADAGGDGARRRRAHAARSPTTGRLPGRLVLHHAGANIGIIPIATEVAAERRIPCHSRHSWC